jgi:hypothetical protein
MRRAQPVKVVRNKRVLSPRRPIFFLLTTFNVYKGFECFYSYHLGSRC